jgi:hypothetical protein
MIRAVIVLGLLCFCITACCQKLIFHKNRYRQATYKTGDRIAFQLKGDKTKHTDLIRGFEDGQILFRDYQIDPREISHLYVDDKTRVWFILRYKYEKLFLLAGAGFLTLELLNTGELNEETLLIGGSLITAGALARLLISKKMRIRGKRRLLIVG